MEHFYFYNQKESVQEQRNSGKIPIRLQNNKEKPLISTENRLLRIPVITGPTASGKSAIAQVLAEEMGWDIISCDSRQIYREMNIGTAKAITEERAKVHHWLLDIIDPSEAYSVYRFIDDASNILRKLKEQNRVGLVCGGTGLYLRGLLEGAGLEEQSDLTLRAELTLRAQLEGCVSLHNELRLKDPASAEKFHANDVQRVIRALSVYYQTGIPISELHKLSKKQTEFEFVVVKITSDRDKLYEKINKRVDDMVESGLYDEFRALVSRGYGDSSPGMHCVGYKEFFAVEKNECSFNTAVELIKRNTRRFAKRQITWFSHQQFGIEIDLNEVGVNWKEKIKKSFL